MTKLSALNPRLRKLQAALMSAVALLVMGFGSQTLIATDQIISGDPLRIEADEYLNMKVFRNQGGTYVKQYYGVYQTFLRLGTGPAGDRTLNVSYDGSGAPYDLTAVTHIKSNANTIVTTVTTGDLVSIQHTVTYSAGAEFYRHEWLVSNGGSTTYGDVALRYGGDTYFGGSDSGTGYYDSNLGMVFSRSSVATGLSGMFGAPESPATGWYADNYSLVVNAMAAGPILPNSANNAVTDNGMGLEWVHPTDLEPGQSFTIVAYEKWTEAGVVQVIAPAPFAADPGESLNISFTITNLQATTDFVHLAVTAPTGWEASVAQTTMDVAANSSTPVSVAVTIPSGASGIGKVELTLTKLDPDTSAVLFSHSDYVNVTVRSTTTQVTSPIIPLSTNDRTVYTAISPSTPEGAESILAALSGRASNVTRAFAWNTYDGIYIELPAEVALLPDGVLPETGIFIATRRPLSYSLSGTPYDASYTPYQLPIPPGTDAVGVATGWTFAGIPPIKFDRDTIQTDFVWPSATVIPQFQPATTLEILVNGEPVSDSELIQLMGDPDSTEMSTTQPYWWDSALGEYRQVSTLRSGEAYWFKNNSTDVDIRIQVSGSQRVIIVNAQAASGKAAPVVQAKKSTYKVTNRGAPPALPGGAGSGGGSGAGKAASASGGGGCGSGSGLGLFSMLMFLFGLRFLVARR